MLVTEELSHAFWLVQNGAVLRHRAGPQGVPEAPLPRQAAARSIWCDAEVVELGLAVSAWLRMLADAFA